jgi:hypothetical protein
MFVDPHTLPPFPKRIPEKLRTIREQLKLSPDEIARSSLPGKSPNLKSQVSVETFPPIYPHQLSLKKFLSTR